MNGQQLVARASGPAPDHDVKAAARDIFDILRQFDSPKDAGSAIMLAHYDMIVASFPPEKRQAAIELVDSQAELLKELLREGWQ